MDTCRRISGVVLIVMAFAVALHTIIEPLYHTSSEGQPYSPVWSVLGWLMMLPVVLGVIFGYLRKKDADSDGGSTVTREYMAANLQFYGFLFVGIMYLFNWFNQLSPAFTAVGDDTVTLVWILVDAALPLLSGAMGMFLLRGGRAG